MPRDLFGRDPVDCFAAPRQPGGHFSWSLGCANPRQPIFQSATQEHDPQQLYWVDQQHRTQTIGGEGAQRSGQEVEPGQEQPQTPMRAVPQAVDVCELLDRWTVAHIVGTVNIGLHGDPRRVYN